MALGTVTAFFLFDIGDAINLQRVRGEVDQTSTARLGTRPATPTYLQYQQPPLLVEGVAVEAAGHAELRVRFKLFDYGVVSVALTRDLPESWVELLSAGLAWQEDTSLIPTDVNHDRRRELRSRHAATALSSVSVVSGTVVT